MKLHSRATGAGLLFAGLLLWLPLEARSAPASQDGGAQANKYIGVDKCKACHQAEASGNQFEHWKKSGHARAYEILASDAAKAVAKERGIEDPQKSDQCLKCHVTALGAPKEQIKKGFDLSDGVQCEGCHGPGERHMKARFAAAGQAGADPKVRQEVPADEIRAKVDQETCKGCHNEESPSFKPFCFKERWASIGHFDPRKQRTPADGVKCGCEPCACASCSTEHGKEKK